MDCGPHIPLRQEHAEYQLIMDNIILIETSTALCSVALSEKGTITACRESSAPKAHASLTAVFVHEILSERDLQDYRKAQGEVRSAERSP